MRPHAYARATAPAAPTDVPFVPESEPVAGITRDTDAPNTDGAYKANAIKHVANFLISCNEL